eukprot:7079436-Pyramimonas_sp.AAC.1
MLDEPPDELLTHGRVCQVVLIIGEPQAQRLQDDTMVMRDPTIGRDPGRHAPVLMVAVERAI